MFALGHVSGWQIFFWTLAIVVVVWLAAVAIRTYLRLRALRTSLERITAGDATHRLPQYSRGPTGALSRSLARMAGVFNQRLRSLQEQRNELEAVLASMVEGVIAVDPDEKILSLNNVGSELLRVSPQRAIGRNIQEVVRNTALQQFVQKALTHSDPIQGDFVLRIELEPGAGEDRYIQAQGTALVDAAGQRIGALVVLHDVTRLRRLEMIRRDFVANVSHELKTPITAIKGAVETIIEINQTETDPASIARFLGIVSRQADRLHAIIEDLLALARIEQDAERDRVVLETAPLIHVMRGAMEVCAGPAANQAMTIELNCDDEVQARINPALLEQAVVNLLDNAIKYCPPETTVRLGCDHDGKEVVISVADEGPGIEAEHLPRVFERFYRTDKARSRSMGGTGLGLSIVKHIANTHGGRVSVESSPGQGSTFRIHLPSSS